MPERRPLRAYRSRTRYQRPPRWQQRVNRAVAALATVGLAPLDTVSLEVPGRATGRTRRTAVVWVEHQGQRYLVSLGGLSQWVHNVRAAGGRATVVNGSQVPVVLEEVAPEDRARVLTAYAGKRAFSRSPTYVAREHFGVSEHPSVEELADVADRYPVFRLRQQHQRATRWPDAVDQLVAPWMWAFPATYLVHVLEEALAGEGFDSSVARVTGTPLPRRRFAMLNVGCWLDMTAAVAVARNHRDRAWLVPALGTVTAVNGVGHLVGNALTRS